MAFFWRLLQGLPIRRTLRKFATERRCIATSMYLQSMSMPPQIGQLTKSMGLKVTSAKRADGQHAYRLYR